MKIAHLTTSIYGGAGIAAQRLAEATAKFSATEIVSRESLKTNSTPLTIGESNRLMKSKMVSMIQAPGILSKNTLLTPFSISFYEEVSRVLKGTEWDAIHVHAAYNFLTFFDLSQLFNFSKRVVVTLHDERLYTGGCHYSMNCNSFQSICDKCPQAKIPIKGVVKRDHLEALHTLSYFSERDFSVSAPSSWLVQNAKGSPLLRNFPISLIRNCVPDFYFQDYTTPIEARVASSQTLKLGFISHNLMNPYKGLDTFINACRLLSSSSKRKFEFRALGKGLIRSDIQIGASVSKSDSDTFEFLKEIDVLVVPSKVDNLPNVILESLAAGKVVIGAETGGITEILKLFKMPTFPSNSVIDLVKAIEDLDLRDYSSLDIRQQAMELFSTEVISEELLDFYFHRS